MGIINKGKRETQLYQVLKSKKNILQIQSERINIATVFMVLSYKSLNVSPKYYTKVISLRKSERKESWHGIGDQKGRKGVGETQSKC